jgi:hypothetical protein
MHERQVLQFGVEIHLFHKEPVRKQLEPARQRRQLIRDLRE